MGLVTEPCPWYNVPNAEEWIRHQIESLGKVIEQGQKSEA